MRARTTIRKRRNDTGIALLIAIFILLLIGVVAIALIVSSSTETALAGNYRSSTGVYYAAVAGLEEARARLRSTDPNSFKNTASANFLPPSGNPFGVCTPSYVINPVGGGTVAPWDPANAYYDSEFNNEFGGICPAPLPPSPSPSTLSVWNSSPLNGLPFPGPYYKWVRINGVSEQSLNLDTWPNNGIDSNLIYYDSAQQRLNDQGTGSQVLEITALAVLPNGSQKLLQYLVGRSPLTLPPFLSALTLSGSPNNSPVFQAPANNAVYAAKGDDQDCSGNLTGSRFGAIGLFGDYSGSSYSSDLNGIVSGIPTSIGGNPPNPQQNYTGQNSAPDVEYLTAYPANMQTPSQLDAILQAIAQNADVTIPSGPPPTPPYSLPTFTQSALTPLGMSPSNPLTVVINGNLDVTGWTGTGYGLLLVIGKFTYDPATTWNGIVLVIGQGVINNREHGQYKQINGAVFVAQTRDANGYLLTGRIGGGSVSFDPPMQGNGIRYSSDCINRSRPTAGYKILSFHEIAQ